MSDLSTQHREAPVVGRGTGPSVLSHLGDGLSDLLQRVVLRVPDGASLPLTVTAGASRASLDFAVESFRRRLAEQHYTGASVDRMIDDARDDYLRAARRLESPIEKMVLPWLLLADYGPVRPPRVQMWDDDAGPPGGVSIIIAPQMPFGRYRLDFGVVVSRSASERAVFAFECDGEIHGEHRRRDESRDLALSVWGITTVRADGREIHSAPSRSADRLACHVRDWLGEEGP